MHNVIEFIQTYPDIAECVGVIGFMLYIGGFFSVQSGILCGNGITFPVLQVCAASCVLVSLSSAYNLPSFMIQTSYIAIGLFGIALRLRRIRSNRARNPQVSRPANLHPPITFDANCHQTATIFRHSPDNDAGPQNPPALSTQIS